MAASKETMFFDRYYHKGTAWYESLFVNYGKAKAIGEISNTYIFSPDAALRIAQYDTELKLLTVLRNPIERAFSHYLFLLRNGEEKGSFESVLKRRPDLLTRGEYFRLLSEYLKLFDRERLGIYIFDDLVSDQDAFRRSLYRFVGVAENFEPSKDIGRKLPASAPRSRMVAKAVKKMAVWVRDRGFPHLVNQIKESKLTSILYKPFRNYPKMSEDTRLDLEKYYQDDIQKLSALLGRNLQSEWMRHL